ncbi:hypothetical protein [Parasitella parasitica]|uniref:Uncharacterized protein n=1 Tax=Parasitella parasitica TaxID=35722 RepID=A0A0B7NAH8_9FUNG|nr:hypothetical protein [Parasitella parasitica]
MKSIFLTVAILLISIIALTTSAEFLPTRNDSLVIEPDQEICIMSIVPCPKRCRNTCIYPDLPCPKTHPPHCPNEKPRNWPPHQKKPESAVKRDNAAGKEDSKSNKKASCLDRPCPRVVFRPCPKECISSCEFQNPADPCCPYSGKPVCMNLH